MKEYDLPLFDLINDSDTKINFKAESVINRDRFLEILSQIEKSCKISEIKTETLKVIEIIKNPRKDNLGLLNISSNGDTAKLDKEVLLEDLSQIADAQTLERAKYYIDRLKKSLTEIKTGKINDLNLNRWKEYNDILTDSLWVLDKRDKSGAHNAGYWGNFIPQIPNQFLRRYTKQGEWVLDPFLGSGTTLIECKRLGRNGIGVELSPDIADIANKKHSYKENKFNLKWC